ncbi:MAG: hypothetical protein AAFX06_16500 [Planctomycetota bacterium]
MARKNKHIREAIEYAESKGWRYSGGGKSHTVGRLFCPGAGCIVSVYGTPRSPENHARHIRRQVDGCGCTEEEEE